MAADSAELAGLLADREEYRASLQETRAALATAPNAELEAHANDLVELLASLDELIKEHMQRAVTRVVDPAPVVSSAAAALASTGVPAAVARGMRFDKGDVVSARHADGQWYDAVVKKATEQSTYVVEYTGYKETAELDPSDVRTIGETQAECLEQEAKKRAAESRKRKRGDAAAGDSSDDDDPALATFVVPQYLIRKPTDTPEEVKNKHRRLKAMKQQFKRDREEAVHAKRQSSWMDFQAQRKGLKVAKRSTIFSTADAGRVGVAASASSGMTAFRAKRKEFDARKGRED